MVVSQKARVILNGNDDLIVIFLLFLLVVDLEVTELVRVLGRGDHAKPVTQVVLLEVLKGSKRGIKIKVETTQIKFLRNYRHLIYI